MTMTETAWMDQERTSFAPSIPAYVLPDDPYVPTYADPYAANRPAPLLVRWLVPRDAATRAAWRLRAYPETRIDLEKSSCAHARCTNAR